MSNVSRMWITQRSQNQHAKISDPNSCRNTISQSINKLSVWSKESTLAFNNDHTKPRLWSYPPRVDIWGVTDPSDFQSTWLYILTSMILNNISVNGYKPECITSCKLLGVHINEHLKWDDHIKHTLCGWYAHLSILRKLKYLAKYELKKHGLITSSTILTKPFATNWICCCKFVLGLWYVKNFRDVLKIWWLLISERRHSTSWNHALKLCIMDTSL